jgi:hypothetical protein
MQLIVLTREQVETAAFRFERHGNSALRVARHFRRVEDEQKLRICRGLRRVERQFAINLGTVCFKVLEKETRPTPAVQQQVMDDVACWRVLEDGTQDLVVSVDRVREIDRLAEGDPAWASSDGS